MNSPDTPDLPLIPEKPLRKAVATLAITKASQAITLVGRKVYNALLWHSQQDPTARKFSMPLNTVSRQIEFQSRNYEVLKQACRTLSSALVEWESPANMGATDHLATSPTAGDSHSTSAELSVRQACLSTS